jgi:hypothetical protein
VYICIADELLVWKVAEVIKMVGLTGGLADRWLGWYVAWLVGGLAGRWLGW